jgi:hypothetical protein
LNELKTRFPEAYAEHARKYSPDPLLGTPNRQSLMQSRIELLDCLWNDVLFLVAVHPQKLAETRTQILGRASVWHRSFVVDIAKLDRSKLVVERFSNGKGSGVEPFDPARFEQDCSVPEATRDHYRKAHAENRKHYFPFLHVPHYLYKGTIDTAGLPVIEPKRAEG